MSDAPESDQTISQTTSQATGSTTGVDTLRSVRLTRIGEGRFKATNDRGGETFMGSGGDDPDFTPVELLLVAIAGCSAIDVDLITRKRAHSTSFEMVSEGHKVRDEQGNHLTGLRLTVDVRFPEGPEGDAARAVLPRAIAQSRDRLCTVSRTIQLGADVVFEQG
jgi:putative redox protein